jgi:hypothetical protein
MKEENKNCREIKIIPLNHAMGVAGRANIFLGFGLGFRVSFSHAMNDFLANQ